MLFKDVLVDEKLKRRLIDLVKENRISHAQLFLSQAGSHAFALSVAYAQYICCENRGEDDACGVCPSCAKFAKLAHPDLHIIMPNCTTNVVKKDPDYTQFADQFRQFVFKNNYHIDLHDWLIDLGGENKQASINTRDCSLIVNQNSIKSYEGGYKIFILWMAERLYRDAAPKLLKTLEEPESKTLFILITENTDKILSTILSRTQLVKIPKLSTTTVQQQLMKDFNLNEQEAQDLALVADGNYNQAIRMLNNESDHHQLQEQVNLVLGSIIALSRNDFPQIAYMDIQNCFKEIIDKGREYQKAFMSTFIRILRNMLMKGFPVSKCGSAEQKIIETYANVFNLKNTSLIFEECNKAQYHIERNGNSALILTDWYLKLANLIAPSL